MGIFKAYDVRGIYGEELNDDFAYRFGRAMAEYSKPKNVVIGYDSRLSNIRLFSALAKAFTDAGVVVTHIGLVSRPMLNWVAWKKNFDLGIVITASHNPKEYNGFKTVTKGGWPLLYEAGLNRVEEIMDDPKHKYRKPKKKGKIVSKDLIDEYVAYLSSNLSKEFFAYHKKHTVKVAADASNGGAGEIIKKFLEKNSIEYELLFAEPDGNFPCHNPNPLDNNALVVLSRTVVKNKADFGFIVDPDADRIRFVDEKGGMIDNAYIASLVAKELLKHDKKKVIVHDLISRRILPETIRRNKGKDVMSRVGFAFMSKAMRDYGAIFGAESSGHFLFREMNYMDSGMMMLVTVMNMLYSKEHSGKHLSTMIKPFDKYIDIGELNYHLKPDVDKARLLKDIHDYFKANKKKLGVRKILTLDGVSVYLKDSWLNVRPSNTEPLLRLRAEGKNKKDLEKIKKILLRFIPQ